MSFTWFASEPLRKRPFWANLFLQVAVELNMPDVEGAFICAAMCAFQEAGAPWGGKRNIWTPGNNADPVFKANPQNYPHDSLGNDGLSTGPFQQQMSGRGVKPAWGWGGLIGDPEGTRKRMDAYESTKLFMAALKRNGYSAANARAANDSVQKTQKSGVPYAYQQWWNEAHALRAEAGDAPELPAPPPPAPGLPVNPGVGWRGDPVWLPEVLRAEGLDVEVLDVAMVDGHGDFGDIWGVLWHHTGGMGDTPRSLSNGSATLSGPVCNLFIMPTGKVWVIAIGVAYHGGRGIYPGIREDAINQVAIGVECLHTGTGPWPAAQREAMVRVGAAITRFLKYGAERNIAHKEWAGADNPLGINKQGKPDPGNFDMNQFRKDIAARMGVEPTGGDFMASVSQQDADLLIQAAKKVLGIFSPAQVGEASKRGWSSRSIYRTNDAVVDDTVGMLLNIDGSLHELITEHRALLGYRDAIELIKIVADGKGKVTTTDAIARAKIVYDRAIEINGDDVERSILVNQAKSELEG